MLDLTALLPEVHSHECSLDMTRFLFSVILVSLLAGCATPTYQMHYRYEPPAGAEGRQCVQGCEQALAACGTACKAEWNACTARVETEVEAEYLQALKEYEVDLKRYRRNLDMYEWDLRSNWGYWQGSVWDAPWPYRSWYAMTYPLYRMPEQPSRDSVRADLRKAKCKDDCGCLAGYDACFVGCGGRKVPERECVMNCPQTEASSPR